MTVSSPPIAVWKPPTPTSALVFALKAAGLRARRGLANIVDGPPRLRLADPAVYPYPVCEVRTPLRGATTPAERAFEDGKVVNLRRAARAIDGLEIDAGRLFSFWRHVGPPSSSRGFVVGRMLKEGCLVPAVGGGLCQLSNSLYQAARLAGCDIVERHRHSRVVPGSEAEIGRDATVAWNYVDLRFRPFAGLRLSVTLSDDELIVAIHAREPLQATAPLWGPETATVARSCANCDEVDCFRHEDVSPDREGKDI